jgi:hypothetical protein
MERYLVIPMALYSLYILALGILNFLVRRQAIRTGQIPLKTFKAYTDPQPEKVIVVGRHYDNQFQAPMLFLICGVSHLALKQVDAFTVVVAWLFVATRLGHSLEHLGQNRIKFRAVLYGLGLAMIAALWIQLLLSAINQA